MSGHVLVVGSSNIDLVATTDRLPKLGETVLGGAFLQARGGKGANQAVAAARAGADVSILTSLGQDAFGEDCLAGFRLEGIDVSSVQRVSEPTGVALITVDSSGDNCIVVAPGANATLDASIVRAQLAPFPSVDVVVAQLETPLSGVEATLGLARDRGIPTILNPAPAQDLPDELLSATTCLTPNESETAILTGLLPKDPTTAVEAGRLLLAKGIQTAIITLGERGAVLVDDHGSVHQPARRVSAVDTTAAGDTFTGSLAASVSQGSSFREALPYACAAGALAVTKRGAQPAIPKNADIEAVLSQESSNI